MHLSANIERKTLVNTAQNNIRNNLNIKNHQIVLNSSNSLDEKFRAFVPNFFYSKLASGGRFWRSDPNKRTLQKIRVGLNPKVNQKNSNKLFIDRQGYLAKVNYSSQDVLGVESNRIKQISN